jgi:hypothetical protein
MPTFGDIAKEIKKIDLIESFQKFAKQRKINDSIIKAIQKRLFNKGITGDNIKLITDKSSPGNVYADLTIDIKDLHNDPFNRVTLKDTGEFYDKMVTVSGKGEIIIDSDFEKDEGHMQENFKALYGSTKEFEESVLSLTDEELLKFVIDAFVIYWLKELKQ